MSTGNRAEPAFRDRNVFCRSSDGRILALSVWGERILCTAEFLDTADPDYVKIIGDRVIFHAANGMAIYERCTRDANMNVKLELIEATWRRP